MKFTMPLGIILTLGMLPMLKSTKGFFLELQETLPAKQGLCLIT